MHFPATGGSNIGQVDFYGRIGSLIPTRFANPSGGAFLDSSIVTNTSQAVPEPSTVAGTLIVSSLMLLRRLQRGH
ncbi:PEP-CTERM sorting domain-containing protein [Limnofasciculus baicalensis]|uniref:PEP-CTERM sorting domain-containing protein n=1 Tax=Limnofasciculus baicalensis TaxID=3064906 RepID=UPI0035A166AF